MHLVPPPSKDKKNLEQKMWCVAGRGGVGWGCVLGRGEGLDSLPGSYQLSYQRVLPDELVLLHLRNVGLHFPQVVSDHLSL